jgi:hydrogenase 3 maturation protease
MEMKPMSPASWQSQLAQTLNDLKAQHPERKPRVAVVGVGHDLVGDDAAGLVVARQLQPQVDGHDHLTVMDGGTAPENQTGALRRIAPDLVLLVDAAQMNEAPGTVRWLQWQATTDLGASTHTIPPYILATYLVNEIGCIVVLIGIQPQSLVVDTPLSGPVQKAVTHLIDSLRDTLTAL